MRTSKELQELSNAIYVAISTFHAAVAENLRESKKEFKLLGDNDEGEKECLHLSIPSRHDDLIIEAFDKVRWNDKGNGRIEVHCCEEDYEECDNWFNVDYLGEDAEYIFRSVDWES